MPELAGTTANGDVAMEPPPVEDDDDAMVESDDEPTPAFESTDERRRRQKRESAKRKRAEQTALADTAEAKAARGEDIDPRISIRPSLGGAQRTAARDRAQQGPAFRRKR